MKDSVKYKIEDDLEYKFLHEIIEYTNGKGHEKNIIDSDEGYKVINSKFISTNGTVVKYSDKCFLDTRKGDIAMVLSDVPNGKAIAKCFYIDQDDTYAINQRVARMRIIDGNVDEKYLYYYLNRNRHYLAFDDGSK